MSAEYIHCRTCSAVRGFNVITEGRTGYAHCGCQCDDIWETLGRMLVVHADAMAATAYGDARQAAERADVVAWLNSRDEGDADRNYVLSCLSDGLENGHHVGAAEREAER